MKRWPLIISGILALAPTAALFADCQDSDLDGGGNIGFGDLSILLNGYGPGSTAGDVDGNGSTGLSDLTALLACWGPLSSACTTATSTTWQNDALSTSYSQRVRFECTATPSQATMDALVVLGPAPGGTFGDFAALVRFNDAGRIDVRNGSDYTADVVYPIAAGASYDLRVELNIEQHSYSVFVTGPDDVEVAVATNYAFRTEQANASTITTWATWAFLGSLEICDVSDQPIAAACGDGVDNDGDGLVDGADPGCSGTGDDSEFNTTAGTMPCPSEAAIQAALDGQFIWFNPGLSGGAHTWIFNGAEFGKAAASFCGDTRTDASLLAQIRHLLIPGNGTSATGGFQDQKQLGATSMFTLAKNMPRIWDQLSANERNRIDLMMRGALVSSAFTTSDANYFIVNDLTQRGLNGSTNMNRSWNPNHRNGMIGQVIVATLYFGIDEAKQILATHNHSQFIAELQANNMANLVHTYTRSNSPTAAQVEFTHSQPFFYFGVPHDDIMGLYAHVTNVTYNKNVRCGVNNNNGATGSVNGLVGGVVVDGCSGLPSSGAYGMLQEFDGIDGYGVRSSAHYSHDGWYVNNYIQYVITALGYWQDTPVSQDLMRRVEIGTDDLEFKLNVNKGGGYRNLQNGHGSAAPDTLDYQAGNNDTGHRISFSIVYDVLLPVNGE